MLLPQHPSLLTSVCSSVPFTNPWGLLEPLLRFLDIFCQYLQLEQYLGYHPYIHLVTLWVLSNYYDLNLGSIEIPQE